MFSANNCYSLADIAAVTKDNSCCNGSDGFGFGGGFGWIWILLIFAIFGWGGNGFGNGFGGGRGFANDPAFQGYATRSDIAESFATNNLDSGIRSIQSGLCDSTYALSNAISDGFNATNVAMLQGFNGVQQGLCNTQAQLANCCCETREAIANVNYNLASQSCDTRNVIQSGIRDVIENQNNNTRAIIDTMTENTIQGLRDQLQTANFQLSQQAQSANLIGQLRPTPIPAYIACSPYAAAYGCGTGYSNFNNGNSCCC